MRRLFVLPLVALVLLVSAGSAFADNLKTNVVAGGNDTIVLTGPSGSTPIRYYLQAAGSCDASAASPASVTVNVPPGVTASPSSLSFTACGSDTSNFKTVTFSSGTPGQYTITASISGSGNYNSSTATFTLQVTRPNTAPTVAVTGVSNGASYEKGSVPAAYCNVTDAEDGGSTFAATLSSITGPLASYGLGSRTASCSYTDRGGVTGTATATYSIVDTTAPTLQLPGDKTVEATSGSGADVTYTATATDAVDPSPSVSCTPAAGTFALGTTTVKCTATDAAGNSSAGQFGVTVQDTTRPTLHLPGDATVEATGPSGASHSYTASADDTVDGNLTPSCSPASGATFVLGRTPVNCSAADGSGNTATGGFNVDVVDTTAPALHLPGDLTKEATGPDGATASYAATAYDTVAGDVDVSCDKPSGSGFGLGTTTVSCTAVDGYGNLTSGHFTVKVVDTTKPSLQLPDDITVEATKSQGADVSYAATATDLVDGTVPTDCTPANGTFALGTTTVDCSATDAAGNTTTGSFTVKVTDTTAPAFSNLPDNQVLEATGPSGAATSFSAPTATDLVDGDRTVSCDHASGATFPLGVTTVTCTASDTHGNSAETAFAVTVQDTSAPTVTTPGDQTAEATGPSGAAVNYPAASAYDAVDGDRPTTCDPASGAVYPLGTTPVVCHSSDTRNNTGYGAFSVTVQDTTGPALHLPSDKTAEATGPSGAVVNYTATATDLVDGDVTVNCDSASGALYPLATTTVHCTAYDSRGNHTSGSFTVKVVDTTAPTLQLPADISAYATSASGAKVTYSALSNDVVDGPGVPSCTPASGSTFAPGTTTVTCTATDAAGNTKTGSFKVTVGFSMGGFLPPVDGGGVTNTMKAGATAPIKWQVSSASGGYIGDVGIVNKTASGVVSCSGGIVDSLDTYATGGTSLRYDTTSNQYIYNWQSPKQAGKCYQVTIWLTDGTSHSAVFQLK